MIPLLPFVICALTGDNTVFRRFLALPSPRLFFSQHSMGKAQSQMAQINQTILFFSSQPANTFRGGLIRFLVACKTRSESRKQDDQFDACKVMFISMAEGLGIDNAEVGDSYVMYRATSSNPLEVGTRFPYGEQVVEGFPSAPLAPARATVVERLIDLARKGRYDCNGLFPGAVPKGAAILRDVPSPGEVANYFGPRHLGDPRLAVAKVNAAMLGFMALSPTSRKASLDFFITQSERWYKVYEQGCDNKVWDMGKIDWLEFYNTGHHMPLPYLAGNLQFVALGRDKQLHFVPGHDPKPGTDTSIGTFTSDWREIKFIEGLVRSGATGI
jgi:hypothetical protein